MSEKPPPLFHLAAALGHVLHAHEYDSLEYAMAVRMLMEIGDNQDTNHSGAFALLHAASPAMLDVWMLRAFLEERPKRERLMYLIYAVEIAALSGKVSEHERLLLESLAHRLGLSNDELRHAIELHEDEEEDKEPRQTFADTETMARAAARSEVLFGVASVLREILQAHSSDSRERVHAASMLSELVDDRLGLAAALRLLDSASDEDFPSAEFLEDMSLESRLFPLNLAVDVALVDGKITTSERHLLEGLCRRLFLPESALDHVLTSRSGGGARHGSRRSTGLDDIRAAYHLLGIPVGSDIAVIRTAHKRLIRENHPDIYPEADREAATRRSSEINVAYDLLIGAA